MEKTMVTNLMILKNNILVKVTPRKIKHFLELYKPDVKYHIEIVNDRNSMPGININGNNVGAKISTHRHLQRFHEIVEKIKLEKKTEGWRNED